MLANTYFPSSPRNLSGSNRSGRGKLFGSFMINDKFAKKADPAENVNPSTSVVASVRWAIDRGATWASLCTSEIVALE